MYCFIPTITYCMNSRSKEKQSRAKGSNRGHDTGTKAWLVKGHRDFSHTASCWENPTPKTESSSRFRRQQLLVSPTLAAQLHHQTEWITFTCNTAPGTNPLQASNVSPHLTTALPRHQLLTSTKHKIILWPSTNTSYKKLQNMLVALWETQQD